MTHRHHRARLYAETQGFVTSDCPVDGTGCMAAPFIRALHTQPTLLRLNPARGAGVGWN